MRVVVINGSPSGESGITAQYAKYLEQRFPEHAFQVVEVARRIHHIEQDAARLDAIVADMTAADAILWAYPVYVMLVPAQLKRFIELLFAHPRAPALRGKVATSLSTSAHHYDHTTHDYMHGVCVDLGMAYVRGFSAGDQELLTDKGRRDLLGFARDFFLHAAGEPPIDTDIPRISWSAPRYAPLLPPAAAKTSDKKIVVISDADDLTGNLQRMIDVFERSVSLPVDRIDLATLRMDGGCLGCLRCADDGQCGYKDGYAAAFARVMAADVVIYAGAVRDRYLSARMKTFTDRYFSNGHRPVLAGKLVGYIVSGPLAQLATLREILEASIELGCCHRLAIVTDEAADEQTTTERLRGMARAVERWVEDPWYAPPTFRGHAAYKNFRDLVYSNKGFMTADHRYYKAHGLYDFPQNRIAWRLFNGLVRLLKRLPLLGKRLSRAIMASRTRAYQRVLTSHAR